MKIFSRISGRYLAVLILLPVLLIAGTGKAAAASSSKTTIAKHKTSGKVIKKKTKRKNKTLAYRVVYKKLKSGKRVRYIVRAYTPVPSPTNKPISTSPTPAPIVNQQAGYSIEGIVNAINAARVANGLPAVRINTQLNQAASIKSADMSKQNYFAHTNPQGKSDFAFIDEVGYCYQSAGSNLAEGDFGSNQALVDAWMNSPGHRANILASFGQEIGVGISGKYFTMFIARPL